MKAERGGPERSPRRKINGVVLVDKPTGITSNAALQRVRRAFNADKAGHTGTLDPLASGLLPVCLGEATKFSVGLLDADKRYRAVIQLGVRTETGDSEGAIVATRLPPSDFEPIELVLHSFRGDIQQRPHRYSAIKRDGRALYSYARAGEEVEIAPRAVSIHALDVESWEPPLLTIDVFCSKGTYIRSLAEDIGEAIGCGAHVVALRRTMVGHLALQEAASLEAIEASGDAFRDSLLRPMSVLVGALPRIELEEDDARHFLHGRRVATPALQVRSEALFTVHRRSIEGDKGFLGIARICVDEDGSSLVPARVISPAGDPATGKPLQA